jgi:hypothetical protein
MATETLKQFENLRDFRTGFSSGEPFDKQFRQPYHSIVKTPKSLTIHE